MQEFINHSEDFFVFPPVSPVTSTPNRIALPVIVVTGFLAKNGAELVQCTLSYFR